MQRKIRKTDRNLCCLVLLSAVLLTACGGATGTQRSSEKNSSPVSGGAVSEGAVTEKVAKMEAPTESMEGCHYFSYDIETGKKKRLTKKDPELYYLYILGDVSSTDEFQELLLED